MFKEEIYELKVKSQMKIVIKLKCLPYLRVGDPNKLIAKTLVTKYFLIFYDLCSAIECTKEKRI